MHQRIRRSLKSLPYYPRLRQAFESVAQVGTIDVQWGRVVMNRETRKLIDELQPHQLEALEISGNTWGQWTRFKRYESVFYPEFDICDPVSERTYDLIIAEQVFEHLLWPYRAGRAVHRLLNPGGYFLMTTPFMVRVHNAPTDCSRWTETGIKYFLAECGFDLLRIQTGSWGNRACVQTGFHSWPRYRRLFHSLRNEAAFPVHVWALAQKEA